MKKLSDFSGERGIEVAAEILGIIMEILVDDKNAKMKNEENRFKMFSAFMRNSPKQMKKIFAILSEKEEKEFDCNGAEAMENILILANDPIIIGLFTSQGQTGDAKSSGSASENIEE